MRLGSVQLTDYPIHRFIKQFTKQLKFKMLGHPVSQSGRHTSVGLVLTSVSGARARASRHGKLKKKTEIPKTEKKNVGAVLNNEAAGMAFRLVLWVDDRAERLWNNKNKLVRFDGGRLTSAELNHWQDDVVTHQTSMFSLIHSFISLLYLKL